MSESPLAFTVGTQTVRGTLHLPEGDARVPAVLWLHGFTANRNEAHRLYVEGARRLAQAGIASLRFDFRGSGESDGEFSAMSVRTQIEDARAALAQLRAVARVDAERLVVVGFSLGSAIASQLADEAGLVGMVHWSPMVFPVPIFARMGLYAAHPELTRQGFIDRSGFKVGRDFLSELPALDPLGALAHWDKPLYVLYGGQDMVATSENPEALLSEVPSAAGDVLPEADHLFATVSGRTWLLDHTERWITAQLVGLASARGNGVS